MKEAKYSIKDLEKLSGIKAHTLRIWEKRYGLLTPERTGTNIRYYSDADLRKILNIALLNRQGYKISQLSKLSDESLNEKVISITQNEFLTDVQMDSLLSAMVDMDENKFDKIINKAIINFGFEETLTRVIFPLFERIGLLWQTNAINPAQEHFVSNLIRQKILVAIDGLFTQPVNNSKTFYLFLRDGEWHELGLLILFYFIRKNGHKVVYFGQSLPLHSLVEISRHQQPDCLATIITCSLNEQDTRQYIESLSASFPLNTIYLSGLQIRQADDSLPGNVKLITSLPEFKEELHSLTAG